MYGGHNVVKAFNAWKKKLLKSLIVLILPYMNQHEKSCFIWYYDATDEFYWLLYVVISILGVI